MNQSPRFSTGQCWVSVSEPELGLGKVIVADRRFVELSFAGNRGKRKYGADSAPLRRVIFKAGDIVKEAGGNERKITSVKEAGADGLVNYVCDDGIVVSESAVIDSISGFPTPLKRLLKGNTDRSDDFSLRVELLRLKAELFQSPIRGFAGGRIELMPHQLSIASEATSRRSARVLLADETGLGKTIEACLILHRFILTGRVRRCLICVPESLLHQWFVELLRRFNLLFRLFTKEHFDSLAEDSSPFREDQLGIISLTYLAQDDKLCAMAAEAGWDMVIVDEAHHLAAHSKEFDCVRRLSENSQSLILLTATPRHCGGGHRFAGLLDFLGVGRIMFRTTRRQVEGFPRRIVHIESLSAGDPLKLEINEEYRRLAGGETRKVSRLLKDDPRILWLIRTLRSKAEEKFLVICATKERAAAFREALLDTVKIDIALFHEDMTLLQRDRNAAWFTEENGARVLVSSEIGSEGRNFQCCRNLVLFDLPPEPESLEQRIGRLDRIGQGPFIHIFTPYVADSGEEILCRWYHEGLGMLEKNVPAAVMTGEAMRERLLALLRADRPQAPVLEAFLQETEKQCAEISRQLEESGDQSLEISAFCPQKAMEIKNAVLDIERKRLSALIMEPLFKHYGAVVEDTNKGKKLLITDYITDHRFPLPRQERPLITYARDIALLREDIEFVSIDHPMVIDSLDLFLSSDFGTSVLTMWKDTGEEALLLETIYILECIGPESLNIQRFLPPLMIRAVVNRENVDVTNRFPAKTFYGKCAEIPGNTFLSIDLSLDDSLPPMLKASDGLAAKAAGPLIARSLKTMRETFDAEVDRLRRLRQKDPSFPKLEIELCLKEKNDLEKYLAQSRVRLDSIRVIVTTD